MVVWLPLFSVTNEQLEDRLLKNYLRCHCRRAYVFQRPVIALVGKA